MLLSVKTAYSNRAKRLRLLHFNYYICYVGHACVKVCLYTGSLYFVFLFSRGFFLLSRINRLTSLVPTFHSRPQGFYRFFCRFFVIEIICIFTISNRPDSFKTVPTGALSALVLTPRRFNSTDLALL